MKPKAINCNLLDAPVQVIGQNCNAQCVMSSGVALAIKTKYPKAYQIDCATGKGDRNKFGKMSFGLIDENKYVANLYGQFNYGTGSRKVNYEAFYTALECLRAKMIELNLKSVAFPWKICCALAGGSWSIIEAMITDVFEETDIEVLVCKI